MTRANAHGGAAWISLICVYAFALNYIAATRGFFALDQSITFDGAYRVAIGQVPFRDFVFASGLTAYLIHAIPFLLLGVNFQSFILGSSLVNVFAALAAMRMVSVIAPGNKIAAAMTGLLTATWFYPPFGTPNYDQNSNFLSLLGLLLLVEATRRMNPATRRYRMSIVLAGVIAVLSFLSKQNTGVFILPAYAVLLAWRDAWRKALRDCLLFGGGLAAGTAGLFAWLVLFSDTGAFLRHYLALPAATGAERLGGVMFRLPVILLNPEGSAGNEILAWLWFPLAAYVLFRAAKRHGRSGSGPGLEAAVVFALALICFQNLYMHSGLNQDEMQVPFLGLICGIAYAVTMESFSAGAVRRTGRILLILLAGFSVVEGVLVAWRRTVNEFASGTVFGPVVEVERLKPLRWASEPGNRGTYASEGDLRELLDLLGRSDGPFFIFPEYTILYGVTGREPPQPLLWFHPGLTYSGEHDPATDAAILNGLVEADIKTFVAEDGNAMGIGIYHFPAVHAYIQANFRLTRTIGPFRIYGKRQRDDSDPPTR